MTMVGSIQNVTNLSHGDPREHLSQMHNSLAMCSQMYQPPAMPQLRKWYHGVESCNLCGGVNETFPIVSGA